MSARAHAPNRYMLATLTLEVLLGHGERVGDEFAVVDVRRAEVDANVEEEENVDEEIDDLPNAQVATACVSVVWLPQSRLVRPPRCCRCRTWHRTAQHRGRSHHHTQWMHAVWRRRVR